MSTYGEGNAKVFPWKLWWCETANIYYEVYIAGTAYGNIFTILPALAVD